MDRVECSLTLNDRSTRAIRDDSSRRTRTLPGEGKAVRPQETTQPHGEARHYEGEQNGEGGFFRRQVWRGSTNFASIVVLFVPCVGGGVAPAV